jgi:hypothetical protein
LALHGSEHGGHSAGAEHAQNAIAADLHRNRGGCSQNRFD